MMLVAMRHLLVCEFDSRVSRELEELPVRKPLLWRGPEPSSRMKLPRAEWKQPAPLPSDVLCRDPFHVSRIPSLHPTTHRFQVLRVRRSPSPGRLHRLRVHAFSTHSAMTHTLIGHVGEKWGRRQPAYPLGLINIHDRTTTVA